MTLQAPTRKEALWLTCRQKTCCYAAVIPTGLDVWRIARSLELPPSSFLVYFHTPQPRPDAFFLDRSGRAFRIALAKGPKLGGSRSRRPAPCVFLLRLRGGEHRCGLGDLRPAVCRTFPSEIADGVVCIRPDHGCVCREWTLADVDLAEERAALDERDAGAAAYCRLVAAWNARVLSAPTDTTFDFDDYCAFVLAAYDNPANRSPLPNGERAPIQ